MYEGRRSKLLNRFLLFEYFNYSFLYDFVMLLGKSISSGGKFLKFSKYSQLRMRRRF